MCLDRSIDTNMNRLKCQPVSENRKEQRLPRTRSEFERLSSMSTRKQAVAVTRS